MYMMYVYCSIIQPLLSKEMMSARVCMNKMLILSDMSFTCMVFIFCFLRSLALNSLSFLYLSTEYHNSGGLLPVTYNNITSLSKTISEAGAEIGYKTLDCNGAEMIG